MQTEENPFQLNIFSWQAELLTEGWELLGKFDFANSEKKFSELTFLEPGHDEAVKALEIVAFWKNSFEIFGKVDKSEGLKKIVADFNGFHFSPAWGPQVFRKALLNKIVSHTRKTNVFFLDGQNNLSTLLVMQGKVREAEKELQAYIGKNGESPLLLWQLAEVQWKLNKANEAKRNYLFALLTGLPDVSFKNMSNEILSRLIEKHGQELAPAWAFLYNHLPLLTQQEYTDLEKKHPSRTVKACLLFVKAEQAKKENNFSEAVGYRKQLSVTEPELFKAYMMKLAEKNTD